MSVIRLPGVAVNYDEYSIARQRARYYDELLGPPEVEIPTREYSQRNENSEIPDGSEFISSIEVPVGETISKFCYRLSKQAAEAWEMWTNVNGDPFLTVDGPMFPIEAPIETLMLSEEEHIEYIRNRRVLLVEEGRAKQDELRRQSRAISESALKPAQTESPEYDGPNRFYNVVEYVTDEFGEIDRYDRVKDRCDGRNHVSCPQTVQPSNAETVVYAPSHQERLALINLSHYETAVWRPAHRAEEDNEYIPSTSPSDDPDFTPPISLSSRNFNIYPPASRPYNITFRVILESGAVKILKPKQKKDYTSVSTVEYLLRQRGIKYKSVEIHSKIVGGVDVPLCRFETDLRVTYSPDCVPNPVAYNKVDPTSKLGQKILLLLNEQPYLFREFYFDYDGKRQLAIAFTLPKPQDKFGPRVYWVYVSRNENTLGRPAFLRSRMVAPQTTFHTLKNYRDPNELPNYLKVELPLGATVRVTKGYGFYKKEVVQNGQLLEEGRYVEFPEIETNFVNALKKKGYELITILSESPNSTVLLYKFLHVTAKTPKQRLILLRQLQQTRQST